MKDNGLWEMAILQDCAIKIYVAWRSGCDDSIANFLAFLFTQSREMFGQEH